MTDQEHNHSNSNHGNSTAVTSAHEKKAGRLSLVWLIPFLALLVTALLLWQNSLDKGPEIELQISSADGIEPGRTLVKVRSVTVGRVTAVKLSPDYSSAQVTIQMEADTEDLLRRDTKFWLVKPRVESAGISGLNTLISGSYFAMIVGTAAEHATSFTALDEPPPLLPQSHGVVVKLLSQAQKRLNNGDPVNYRGFTVGRVVSDRLIAKTDSVEYELFIFDAYKELLNGSSKFWITSGFDLSLGTEGVTFSSPSVESILRGGCEFASFSPAGSKEHAAPFDTGITHLLFNNRQEAELEAAREHPLTYVSLLPDSVSSIAPGSGVYYKNVRIGEVLAAPWYLNDRELFQSEFVPVLLSFNFKAADEAFINSLFEQKLKQGTLCAQAGAGNIISGDNRILLSLEHKCKSEFSTYRGIKVIPGFKGQSLQDKLNAAADKLNELDVAGISTELKAALSSTAEAMRGFAQSNERVRQTELLEKMVLSFESFTRATRSYAQGSEIHQQLQETLQTLQQIMRDLNPAISELGQAPSSILFGSSTEDPQPKAAAAVKDTDTTKP